VVSRHAGNTRNRSRIASDFFWSRGKPNSCEIVTEKHVADGDDAYVYDQLLPITHKVAQ
jgi:hypothetical protein